GEGLVIGVGAIGNRILNQGYAETRQCVEDVMAVEHIIIKHRLVEVLGEIFSQSVEGFGRPCLLIGPRYPTRADGESSIRLRFWPSLTRLDRIFEISETADAERGRWPCQPPVVLPGDQLCPDAPPGSRPTVGQGSRGGLGSCCCSP